MSAKKTNGFSVFRKKIDDKKYEHDASLNRDLDKYSISLIKVVGIVAAVIGLLIIIAFWYWVIKMLYKVG
jgi:hypothetical protein